MLSKSDCKNILSMLRKYKRVHAYLAKHYESKHARQVCDSILSAMGLYLMAMHEHMDDITSNDVKYFALIVDVFEPMRRKTLFNQLQTYADFDVEAFVAEYNSGSIKSLVYGADVYDKEKSVAEVNDLCKKYKHACKNMHNSKHINRSEKLIEIYRTKAYSYARAIVDGRVEVTPENARATYIYLNTVCFPYVDGDAADKAKKMLKEQIHLDKDEDFESLIIKEESVSHDVAEKDGKTNKYRVCVDNAKKSMTNAKDKVAGVFRSVNNKLQNKIQEKKSEIETAKQNREIIRDAERASKQHWKGLKNQEKQQKLEQLQNATRTVEEKYEDAVIGIAEKISNKIESVVDKLKYKYQKKKSEIETAKQNREIVRDAERASREHWKKLKKQEKSRVATTIISDAQQDEKVDTVINNKNNHKNLFVRVAVGTAVAAVLFGGIALLQNNKHNKVEKEPVKKEVKAEKPVVREKVAEPVPVDTAYMNAMNNYCNSAMDIIAGEKKKNDVMSKLNNQVKNGNLVLNDTISIERVAYTYFMYREYGFNIDVLNLAVNGNQKLSDAEQAELLNVISEAGERGKGVQQMAKQKLESRGKQLKSGHSKFENATKAQQRQYLVNRGILKKAHVR
jgi:hypothetical protein